MNGYVAGPSDMRVYDADGRLVHQGPADAVPVLPAGRYFVNLRRIDHEKVADWVWGWFEVRGAVGIESIQLDADAKTPDEPVRATVVLGGTPPEGSYLLCEIVDNFGRGVWRDTRSVSPSVTFEGEASRSLHL